MFKAISIHQEISEGGAESSTHAITPKNRTDSLVKQGGKRLACSETAEDILQLISFDSQERPNFGDFNEPLNSPSENEECQLLLSILHNSDGMFYKPLSNLQSCNWVRQVLDESRYSGDRAVEEPENSSRLHAQEPPFAMATPRRRKISESKSEHDDVESSDLDRKPAAVDLTVRQITLDPLQQSPHLRLSYSNDDNDHFPPISSPPLPANHILEKDGIHVPASEDFLDFKHRQLEEFLPLSTKQLFEGIDTFPREQETYEHGDSSCSPARAFRGKTLPTETKIEQEDPDQNAPSAKQLMSNETTDRRETSRTPPRRNQPRSASNRTKSLAAPSSTPTKAKPSVAPPRRVRPKRATRPRSTQGSHRRAAPKTANSIEPTEAESLVANTARKQEAMRNWYTRLNQLNEYKSQKGNCNVPQKYPKNHKLGIWVNKQRMEKKFMDDGKKTSMTQFRVEALDRIGFEWAKRKGDFSWNVKYQELLEFQQQHGHCDVPTKFEGNKALGRWVSTQRSQYKLWRDNKKTHMTQGRFNRLQEVGFKFDMLPYLNRSGEEDDDNDASEDASEGDGSDGVDMEGV